MSRKVGTDDYRFKSCEAPRPRWPDNHPLNDQPGTEQGRSVKCIQEGIGIGVPFSQKFFSVFCLDICQDIGKFVVQILWGPKVKQRGVMK